MLDLSCKKCHAPFPMPLFSLPFGPAPGHCWVCPTCATVNRFTPELELVPVLGAEWKPLFPTPVVTHVEGIRRRILSKFN